MADNITCKRCGNKRRRATSAEHLRKETDGSVTKQPLCFLCARALPPDETILVRAAMLKGVVQTNFKR